MKVLALAALVSVPLAAPAAAEDVAIADVTVVDARTGALAPHQTVVVHKGG